MLTNFGTPAELFSSPDLFPFDIDITGGQIRLALFSETVYQTASFLDERAVTDTCVEFSLSVEDIARAEPAQAPQLNYIFHLGRVGSTLLARVLGRGRSVFSIREPFILRRLASFEFELRRSLCPWPPSLFNARLDTILKLLARVYHPGQISLVKTTSFVSEMAPLLMARAPQARAILLIAHPQTFIAGILAGEGARGELSYVSVGRLARLRYRFPEFDPRLDGMSEGELAALGWVCELLGLAEANRRYPERTLWMDFDHFLLKPRPCLEAVLVHLNGSVEENELGALLESPDFGSYAKAPEHVYDGSVRHRLISDALVAHHNEVERGLAWINAAANRHRGIANAARAAATALRKAAPVS